MKVILKQDFDLLGNAGEIKEVKSGYARNYLIPRGIAVLANDSNKKVFEEIQRQRKRKTIKETTDAEEVAAILRNTVLNFKVKTGEEDKVYGSITAQMIFDELESKGFATVEKRKIHIAEPIKSLGEHEVDVKLYINVTAKLKIIVEKEHAEDINETDAEVPAPEESKAE